MQTNVLTPPNRRNYDHEQQHKIYRKETRARFAKQANVDVESWMKHAGKRFRVKCMTACRLVGPSWSDCLNGAVSLVKTADTVPARAEQRVRSTNAAQKGFVGCSSRFATNLA